MAEMIRTEGVGKVYTSGGTDFRALNNINISIPEGKLTILRGRSG